MTETDMSEDGPKSHNRIVAFVDILGAGQAAISGQSSELVGEIFRLGRTMQWTHIVRSTSPDGGETTQKFKPGVAQFSDCLLLWSDPLDGLEPEQFVRTAGSFLWSLCAELGRLVPAGVPFRAGVSEGLVSIYPDLNIYAGRPIAEAAKLESCQDWLGAAMLFADHPDRLIKRPDQIFGAGERSMFEHYVVPDVQVPLKMGTPEYLSEHTVMALNWALSEQEKEVPAYENLRGTLQALQANAGTGAGIQEKYERAIQFLAEVEHKVAKRDAGGTGP